MNEFKLAVEGDLELVTLNIDLTQTLADLQKSQSLQLEAERNAAYGYILSGLSAQMTSPIGVGLAASGFLKQKLEFLHENCKNNLLDAKQLDDSIYELFDATELIDMRVLPR